MSDERYAIVFIRLGILTSLFFAVFWTTWHLLGNQVPAHTTLDFDIWSYNFALSRWWDILFSFFMVNIYAWIMRSCFKFIFDFEKDAFFGMDLGFVVGLLAAGLFLGLMFGIVAGLIYDLIFAFVIGFVIGLCFLLKVLFSSNFLKSIYSWFMAKDMA